VNIYISRFHYKISSVLRVLSQYVANRKYLRRCAVIWATNHLGDSHLSDRPTRRQPTGRHEPIQPVILRVLCQEQLVSMLNVFKFPGCARNDVIHRQ